MSAPVIRRLGVDTGSLSSLAVHRVIRKLEFSETSNFHSLSTPYVL
jgi:hypothetical protein